MDIERALSRLLAKTVRTDDGCLVWTGGTSHKGYGSFWLEGRLVGAHVAAYTLMIGPVPPDMELDHICENPPCIEVFTHLRLLTHKRNILAGNSPNAINARKTHCKNGHRFTRANTYVKSNGHRRCRECKRQQDTRYRHGY